MKNLLLIIVLLISYSCQKEETDYRDKYTGTFSFATYSVEKFLYDGEDTTFVHKEYDTILTIGSTEKFEDDRLKIVFWDNYYEPDFEHEYVPVKIHGLIYPIVSDSGIFEYPVFDNMESSYFFGNILNNDSLYFQYGVTRWTQAHEVQVLGKRIK